ncbi:NUDIX hydrolase [Streptomyces sp. NPDC006355]|uniref:NUDIX hydrolase n=1 Tax=Streptomyces sp. NPDC006355 TaxID=3156758 RepID=UPI0033B6A055
MEAHPGHDDTGPLREGHRHPPPQPPPAPSPTPEQPHRNLTAPVYGSGLWQFPGGNLDTTGEGPLQTARREAVEETGLDLALDTPKLLLTRSWTGRAGRVITNRTGITDQLINPAKRHALAVQRRRAARAVGTDAGGLATRAWRSASSYVPSGLRSLGGKMSANWCWSYGSWVASWATGT